MGLRLWTSVKYLVDAGFTHGNHRSEIVMFSISMKDTGA